MEYREEDFLMLSGIQHFVFCQRQWALIHVEQQWQENEHTVTGELMHKRAHDAGFSESRKDLLISRGMPVFSRTLGISGACDVVEFRRCEGGVRIFGHRGTYQVYPVEYKKGSPKESQADILQLTAQAMCLEEMLMTHIPAGALYYGQTHGRQEILFTQDLRDQVRNAFEWMHQYYERQYTPKVKWSESCNACSLKDICLPRLGKATSAGEYIRSTLAGDKN